MLRLLKYLNKHIKKVFFKLFFHFNFSNIFIEHDIIYHRCYEFNYSVYKRKNYLSNYISM